MPDPAPAVRYITVWPGPRKVRYVRMDLFEEAVDLAEESITCECSYEEHVGRLAKLKAVRDGEGTSTTTKENP